MDLHPLNPYSMIDYGLMSQAIFNILHNAFIYTPEGTTITIASEITDKIIKISISDNGNGLSKDSINRLFEKFYRPPGTKAGGTGLGLSIAKGFIEAHGGSVSVRSNEPSGLIFDILLPLYDK
jgi:two-component system sensor histidine kinase KdpD